ncbi:MAG: response regulator [Solirubrobacterales bacterium]|nr:response regulator [Solirubrobacterales bacterium]
MDDGARVLVVDDEPMVRDVLSRYLERGGFEVEAVADGERALAAFEASRPDLVLLDLMLPRIDGFEVFRQIRARASSPVIMITARGQTTDRIVGLEIGADDYVSKPFSPAEVVARVRSVLRRSSATAPAASEASLRFDDLEIDAAAREVRIDGRSASLTPKEFDLLLLFASNPRRVFSRFQLLDELWDVAFDGDPATVTVHVRRLREKIEAEPSHPRRLVTVWGVGYRFEP